MLTERVAHSSGPVSAAASDKSSSPRNRVLSIFDINPHRISGIEMFARELSQQLGVHGWGSILCFPVAPSQDAEEFLALPNVTLAVAPEVFARSRVRAATEFVRLLARYRPRIVQVHFLGYISPFPWLARCCGVERIFFTDHFSRPVNCVSRTPMWKRLVTRIVAYPITTLITVSDSGKRRHQVCRTFPESRVLTIHNGVDLSRVSRQDDAGLQFRHRFGIPEDHLLIVQVSWVIAEKGVLDFVAAAGQVASTLPNVHFALVGAGSSLARCRQEAKDGHFEHRITFTGELADPFSEGVFAASDVVCQPSLWQEAFGFSIAEGMAHGKPVLATRVGSIPEIVEDGITGYLVNAGDRGAIADRMLQFAGDSVLRRRMGAAGRAVVQSRLDLAETIARHLSLFGVPEPVTSGTTRHEGALIARAGAPLPTPRETRDRNTC
jgi:glycosyltransferase involved in cell wall biosynthesis